MAKSKVSFEGFDAPIDVRRWRASVEIPQRIFSVDAKRFVQVDLEKMEVASDGDTCRTICFNEKLSCFTSRTRASLNASLLDALDGKRKSSTVRRWLSELSLFGRTVANELGGQMISTLTLQMYLWYTAKKNASQVKLLRSSLLHVIAVDVPCLSADLIAHLVAVPPPKPRGTLEIQNSTPSERPFTLAQVRTLLKTVDLLYLDGEFNPQTRFFWLLAISEAPRPSQFGLLKFKDLKIVKNDDGRLLSATLSVPMVKQGGTSARDFLSEHRLSEAVASAALDQLSFVSQLLGEVPPPNWPLFCVHQAPFLSKLDYVVDGTPVSGRSLIETSRRFIAQRVDDVECSDLFLRRFKHTKLTHLAAMGASLDAIAYAGFQTSTVSLRHYVNLTDEAYEIFETQLDGMHNLLESAFAGKVVLRGESTYRDRRHEIDDIRFDSSLGACSREPCEALACLACYTCPRFEAFEDGPHAAVESWLLAEQARARAKGLSNSAVNLRANVLVAVQAVLKLVPNKA